MVAGKMRAAMGLQKSPKHLETTTTTTVTPPPKPPRLPSPSSGKTTANSSSKGAAFSRYFPRASAQVQPRPPDIAELLRLVEDLRERESRLKTELLEHKLVKESAAIIPVLENEIASRSAEIIVKSKRIEELEVENEKVRDELEQCRLNYEKDKREKESRIKALEEEIVELKKTASFRVKAEFPTTTMPAVSFESTSSDDLSSSQQRFLSMKNARRAVSLKCMDNNYNNNHENNNNNNNNNYNNSLRIERSDSISRREESTVEIERPRHSGCNSEELADSAESTQSLITRSRAPRVPKPPPKRCTSSPLSISLDVSENAPPPPPPPCHSGCSPVNLAAPAPPPPPPPPPMRPRAPLAPIKTVPPPPPPPPPPAPTKKSAPPPPPPLPKATKAVPEKVRRVPEVVEFYHSLMRRDSRRDSGGGVGVEGPSSANARDMIGEIENRSAHLLAIKTDVETQGDFIRFLIKEVGDAAFSDIEDVLPFVKWLDDELSYLVDERAVLKHFDWPEQKADALREAAFGYCDLRKLESEASSFRDDARQPCGPALKKMQALFEKLEHGVYNLSRMRESAAQRYKAYQIPMDWMLENGIVSQIKLASVKLAMKYMKRVSAELESVGGGPEEEELIVQGVRFAFRVHQFAGGFDVETMKAFQELKEKARSCHIQCQGQQHHKFVCRSTPC